MGEKDSLISTEFEFAKDKKESSHGISTSWGSLLALFWAVLFFAVVIPYFYRLPEARTLEDAKDNVFIAERAYKDLITLTDIGNKMTGSTQNEVDAVNFIMGKLKEIKENLLTDYFEMEIDLSRASGAHGSGAILNLYQGVQNIAVKLTPKKSTSQSYLLVNSHFDSKPATSSAGDAGFMVVTMLEVLRVLSQTKESFEHPIVFLFNGSEEVGLLASHGFITQHKWFPFCKALVNLDAGGSGGKEILFQTGPSHSWLVKYYEKFSKHPFGTALAEEIFQSGIIPSDTDFRQFRTYGNIPGLDLGQCFNGFVYHTKYDLVDVIPRESLQNTGDNTLSLVRGLANASELHDVEAHKDGNTVYFDFLGLYFLHYSEETGEILNLSVAIGSIILVFISMWRMSEFSNTSMFHVVAWFDLVLIVQIVSFILGLAVPLIVTYIMDNMGMSLTYYSTPLLVIGLYVVPSLIGLSLPVTIYHSLQGNNKISKGLHLQLSLHAQAVILSLLTIGLTIYGLRSTYVFVIPLGFYALSLVANLLTTLHDRGYAWTGLVKLSQIIPFLYSSYVFYLFIVILTPMQGRSGSASNRDIVIAVLAAAGTVLSFGFLVPLINTFRRPSFVILFLVAITAASVYLAGFTQIGFPYRTKTHGQRVSYLQVRNIYYEHDGTISKFESGYLFSFQDRREEKPFLKSCNLTGLISLKPYCEKYMMCGMPLYEYRYLQHRYYSKWLPRAEPVEVPGETLLVMNNKTVISSNTVRFEFSLTGPPYMTLFIQPYEDVTLSNWTFGDTTQRDPASELPYIVYFTYGIDSSPLDFFLELSKPNGDFNVPLMQLGVAGHYIQSKGDELSVKFASSFPPYSMLSQWPALYYRYIY